MKEHGLARGKADRLQRRRYRGAAQERMEPVDKRMYRFALARRNGVVVPAQPRSVVVARQYRRFDLAGTLAEANRLPPESLEKCGLTTTDLIEQVATLKEDCRAAGDRCTPTGQEDNNRRFLEVGAVGVQRLR